MQLPGNAGMLVVHITGPFALEGEKNQRTDLVRPHVPRICRKIRPVLKSGSEMPSVEGISANLTKGFPVSYGMRKVAGYLKQGNPVEVRVNTMGFPLPLTIKL